MRFLADGPSIPDELLLARDQGRVIFFCGAGVSRARAKLPDFFGLAKQVVSRLGVDQSSPAYKLIKEAQEIDRRVGVSGVISADRVFGLLERDFASRDIEEAVAAALKPPLQCDLSAHEILLDLATTQEGAVQLVTTNFDRLFDSCRPGLPTWQPPRLPNPLRPNEINGVVYLHGRSTPTYNGAEGDGFILSSSEFGRAYLSDGWATSFIRAILERYVVVFVGYTADDPPVQYLLEALRRASGKHQNAYAFQSGERDDAAARWRHKGVEAIAYSPDSDHVALWMSLQAWAERARDPDAWYAKVIEEAKKGPAALQPHDRGQVAHVVSTYEGVRKFSVSDGLPPADWLCVFDKHRRFAKPGSSSSFGHQGPYVDPFDLYGLDSDFPPPRPDPEDHYAKREAPPDAWDAFELNRLDRLSIRDENVSAVRGHWAGHSPRLLPRIGQLSVWLAKICDQPAAVWWAAHQSSLHQNIQEHISWELERSDRSFHEHVRSAWRSLFEAWSCGEDFHRDWYGLQSLIKTDGWSSAVVRRFGHVLRPRLSAKPDFWGGPTPPESNALENDTSRLIRLDVRYPEAHELITVPDEWCAALVGILRRNLELALALESELGGYGLSNISPLFGDDTEGTEYHRSHGLSATIIRFTILFRQLIAINKSVAKSEFLSWTTEDDTIFARLRIWAAGERSIVSDDHFAQLITSLSDAAFWGSYHQRDLLLVLAKRWNKLSAASRRSLEQRLLFGPNRWRREKVAAFENRRAWSILNRIQWLHGSGCRISPTTRGQAKLLRAVAPNWREKYGAKAADSLEGRAGFVKTNTSYEQLLETPLSLLLQQAQALSGRSEDFLVENDPFAGIAAQRPARALTALTYAAEQGDFPEWAWREFLNSEARKGDKVRLAWLIAERLARWPDEKLATIVRPATDWLRDSSTKLRMDCLPTFDRILRKLTSVLRGSPSEGGSGIVRESKTPDWTMEALNSPTGRLAEALFYDPRKDGLNRDQGFPAEWLAHVEALLTLPGNLRRHALVIFSRNLNWFFAVDPKWTERSLLPAFEAADMDDRDAAWSGFLWGATVPTRNLYLRLKSDMLEIALNPRPSHRSYSEIIAGMILAGWGSSDDTNGERFISDNEMRGLLLNGSDEFRSRILWQAQQWSTEKNENSHEIWSSQLSDILTLWPRQISAKSPNISARLCELAFSSGDKFPMIAELVLPLVTTIERDYLALPEVRRSGDNIVDRYPEHALALLYAVLPDDARAWPYGLEGVLQRIGEANSGLNSDEKLVELRHRWDAR